MQLFRIASKDSEFVSCNKCFACAIIQFLIGFVLFCFFAIFVVVVCLSVCFVF